MDKINVLQLMTDSKIGGAERVVLWTAKNLNKQRFNVSICCLAKRGPIFDEAEREGIRIFSLGLRGKLDFLKIFNLIKLLREQKIHILHTHLFHANIAGRVIGRFAGTPIIISSEHIMGLESSWRLFLNKLTSRFADKIIAVSVAVKNFLIKDAKIEYTKIEVVQNGIELSNFYNAVFEKDKTKARFNLSNSDKIIGTVARIHKQKGHEYLLAAAKKIITKYPQVKFLIVGEGPLKEKMQKLSSCMGIEKNIIFTGFFRDVPSIMSVFDIFVLPSLWEGLPITIIEAMAMKKPIIATNVSGNPELIEENVTGFLVSPRDVDSLAEAISKLLDNEQLGLKFAEAGFNVCNKFFTASRMTNEITLIYEQLIENKKLQLK